MTRFRSRTDNPVEKIFRGRLEIEQANAFLYFRKKGLTQKLMHELKYNGNKDLGFYLGELYAGQVADDLQLCKPDLLTTVPLHPRKLMSRGFNQSDEIARGFAQISAIRFVPGLLIRTKNTGTQTKRKRFERWENAGSSFELNEKLIAEGKHIGILDDVITTGATLESCAQKLSKIKGTKISIFSLCISVH